MTDDDNAPQNRPSQLPYQLTATSLSQCANAVLGKAHPAANLEKMYDSLLSMMGSEGNGDALRRRQSQSLDAMFHTLFHMGMQPDEPDRLALLTLCLRAQKQADETIHHLNMVPYHEVMKEYIASKPSESLADLIEKRQRRNQRTYHGQRQEDMDEF
jgi:hypothetical protein